LDEFGPEFAPLPPPQETLGPDGKPLNMGPEGNLPQEQAETQTERLTRIHD
jgi:hypothetical protein